MFINYLHGLKALKCDHNSFFLEFLKIFPHSRTTSKSFFYLTINLKTNSLALIKNKQFQLTLKNIQCAWLFSLVTSLLLALTNASSFRPSKVEEFLETYPVLIKYSDMVDIVENENFSLFPPENHRLLN